MDKPLERPRGLGRRAVAAIVTGARAHGGRLRLQARTGGGLEVMCWLPGRPAWAPARVR